jgi:ankyrin repeat protein
LSPGCTRGAGVRFERASGAARAPARIPGLLAAWAFVIGAAVAGAAEAPDVASFHRAVRLDRADDVRAYLESGGAPDILDANGRTALQVAIRYGHDDLVEGLLAAGAGVDVPDAHGWTALHYAAGVGDLGALRRLLAAGARVSRADPYRYQPLHIAAREGHGAACELLLEAGADVSARIDVGYTAADLAERFPALQDFLRDREAD